MATRSRGTGHAQAQAREDNNRAFTTVAYRGHELDRLIAASSEVRALNQTEILEAMPTIAQTYTDLADEEFETFESEEPPEPSVAFGEVEEPFADEEPAGEEPEEEPVFDPSLVFRQPPGAFHGSSSFEDSGEYELPPASVPVVESTVVLASTKQLVRALDSERPVSFDVSVDIPSSHSAIVQPVTFTLADSDDLAAMRGRSRAPALITLTIAVVAITVGILLGNTFSEALRGAPAAAAAAPAQTSSSEAPTVAPPTPRTRVDEKTPLANGGVREKAKTGKPVMMGSMGSTSSMSGAPRPSQATTMPGQGSQKSQAAFEAELRSKMEKADALGEAQLNRPF